MIDAINNDSDFFIQKVENPMKKCPRNIHTPNRHTYELETMF